MDVNEELQIINLLRKKITYNDVKKNLNLNNYEDIQDLIDEYVDKYGYPVTAKDIKEANDIQQRGFKKLRGD